MLPSWSAGFPTICEPRFRRFFVKLDDAAVVVSRLPVDFRCLHDFHHLAGEGLRYIYLTRGINGISEVFEMVLTRS